MIKLEDTIHKRVIMIMVIVVKIHAKMEHIVAALMVINALIAMIIIVHVDIIIIMIVIMNVLDYVVQVVLAGNGLVVIVIVMVNVPNMTHIAVVSQFSIFGVSMCFGSIVMMAVPHCFK